MLEVHMWCIYMYTSKHPLNTLYTPYITPYIHPLHTQGNQSGNVFGVFEAVSVIIFTVEYALRLFSAGKDLQHLYSVRYVLRSISIYPPPCSPLLSPALLVTTCCYYMVECHPISQV